MTNEDRDALLIRLDERSKATHDFIETAEPRISRLERWRSKITGALIIVGSGLGIVSWELHK
jgi:hypothetical protein